VELYLYSPNTPSWRGAQLKHRGTSLSLINIRRHYDNIKMYLREIGSGTELSCVYWIHVVMRRHLDKFSPHRMFRAANVKLSVHVLPNNRKFPH
jgi:hypothetical protein